MQYARAKGNSITSRSSAAFFCFKKGVTVPTRDPKKTPMTRQELYDLVWSEPMRKVAPRFYCSDSWLAKICRRCGVPTPPRGYWAKKEAGKRAYR
ncbi:MAG: hypothetical protein DWP92_10095, partial [Armatimonadetes bacterium]